MSNNPQHSASGETLTGTTFLGRVRDQAGALAGLLLTESHELDVRKSFGDIEGLEPCDLEALAEYAEGLLHVTGLRRPQMEDSLDTWVTELERHLAKIK